MNSYYYIFIITYSEPCGQHEDKHTTGALMCFITPPFAYVKKLYQSQGYVGAIQNNIIFQNYDKNELREQKNFFFATKMKL